MKIVIAGAGEVGFFLAKQLSAEGHEVVVIDKDKNRLSRIENSLDLLAINGSATSLSVLDQAGISDTDLFVGVTSYEEINITSSIFAKKLGAKSTISRVANPEFVSENSLINFKEIGLDFMIYPEELAAIEAVKLLERSAATDLIEFEDGKLIMIGLKLDKSASIIHKKLSEISLSDKSFDFRIVAIQRGMKTIIPSGNDFLLPNDQVFVITKQNAIQNILNLSGKADTRMKDIIILGGGKIGRIVAKILEDKLSIKLIESNKEKCLELAEYLPNTLVIQGDGRDIDLLAQEGIIDMDGFLALTEDAETNIITSLMAKHLGVKKTISLVDNVDYIPLTQTIGLDSLINKKLIAANSIIRFIRRKSLITIATLHGIDAEVMEFIAKSGSLATKNPIKKLKFPKNAIIGGIIRGESGFISVGDSEIHPNDKVVVFALPEAVKAVEKFFN